MIEAHGIGKFTVQDVTDSADVALATAYNYFGSKEELISVAMETMMGRLAEKIEKTTERFADPAFAFPYGLITVLNVVTFDERFRWLHQRPDALARSIHGCFGSYAMSDIQQGVDAGRYHVDDVETAWRLVSWSAVGISLSVAQDGLPQHLLQTAVINMIKMMGVESQMAADLFMKLPPPLNIN